MSEHPTRFQAAPSSSSRRLRLTLAALVGGTLTIVAGLLVLAFHAPLANAWPVAPSSWLLLAGSIALVTLVVDRLVYSLVLRPVQGRIVAADAAVQQRNQELVDSYQRLFGLREQLANAEQLASVGQTAANVAHQVGTPLNLISGYVQLLKEELGRDTPHAARLAIIEEQIAKVTTTVRSLLDRSRPVGRKARTNAGELVTRVIEVLVPSLTAAGIRHQVQLPAGELPILVDATNFELSLLNLMTNAVDAMPAGGMLHVRVLEAPANRVRIEIADTGHGISEQLMPHIFEPWVSTKQPGRGTGLGLPIARDVVAAHGGSIAVASTPGSGTTFTIELPAEAGRELSRAIG